MVSVTFLLDCFELDSINILVKITSLVIKGLLTPPRSLGFALSSLCTTTSSFGGRALESGTIFACVAEFPALVGGS